MPVIARVAALHFDVRHKNHDFLGHKVAVAAIISLAAVLGFAEAPATPDFTLSASPASIRVARNAKGSAIIATAIIQGFNGSVNLTAAGVPTGATVTFSKSSISSPGAGSSALTISVGNSTPLGSYQVTVTGSSGGDTKSATVTLTVVPSQSLPTGYGWHQLANTNMTSVCLGNVPNGMYSDPTMTTTKSYSFNCNQIEPQSGGAADDNNQRLIVWGGGHQDYAGNEVSVLNLNGTPSWQAFTSPTLPVPYGYDGNAWEGLQPYFVRAVDGGIYQPGASPSSRHTYNGVQYVPYQNKLYSFGGAVANLGYFSEETWSLDMGTKTWTLLGPPYSQAPWFPTTAYNPITGHIVMHDKNKSLLDFDPNTGNWKTLTNQYHVDDGTTAAVDPVNNLFVVVGGNSTDGTTYPSVPTSQTVQVFPLTPPYTMLTWSDPSCDLVYRDSGLAWDSALGLIVGYPGGGNQVYLLNTGAQEVVTPFGTVPSHKCLDVPISLNPSPVKGVDYPQDPESTSSGQNRGIFGRLAYLPSLDTFVMMNDRTKNVWTMQLTGGSSALSFAASTSTGALTVPEGSQGTSVISTTISGGFNNAITLSSAGAPAGTTVSFTPSTIAAPGAGSSTLTINVGASTPAGTYHIVVSAFGGGDTVNTSVTLTVTAAGQPNFTISASPPSLSIQQGNQGTSALTTTVSGGFNSAISLSASGMPTGTTVSFNPSTIPAPGGGNSTMTITVGSSTPTGTYPITVVGNGGGVQQTTTVTLTVTAGGQPNFTLSGSPPSLSIVQGNHGTSTIATTISGGFNSAISLSATGTPTGTTVSFNPSTIAAPSSGNSTMTITVGSSTPAGTYPITVTGNGAGAQQNATVTLTVTAGGKPTFTISASPTSLTIAQGNQGTSTITTAISGGFNSWIDLSAAGMPTGTTVSLNPSRLLAPGAGNSTMTITLGAGTPVGTYPITVTGNGGGIQQNATVSLTVTPSGGGGGRNGIIVYSTSGSTQTNRFVSIGRFFKQGDIPDFAQAVVGGTPLLTQCDVKNRWGDGSLKFGIISFIVPNVATGGTAVSFQDQATGNNTGYLAQGDMLNAQYDFDGVIQLTGTTSPSISARAMLQAGQFRYWLQGPIVTAVIIEDRSGRSFDVNTDGAAGNPLHPIFEAWFYPGAGCVSKGGCVELGITLENAWASSTAAISARNQTFGLTVTTGSAAPVTQIAPGVGNYPATFTQWAFTRWHRAFWLDTAPGGISFDYNGAYLETTGAYPHYDLSWYPSGLTSYAATEYNDYTSKKTNYPTRFTIPGYDNRSSNGGSGMYDQALDSTGEPPDGDWKGLYPTWETVFLLTGDSRMIQEELDNADFAGRFPIWFREADNNAGTGQYFDYPGTCPPTNPSCTPGTVPTQGRVVSVNARQLVTLRLDDWRPGCGASDEINAGAALSYGGWTDTDPSHFPDFAYVPYTLFGKYYYYEQEIMEAAYMVGNYPGCLTLSTPGTSYRQGWLGLQTNGSMTRAMAWGMRSIAYGAFIGLDGQPEAPYFRDKLLNSIAFLEGAWDVPLSITDTADRTTAWTFGNTNWITTQGNQPSPLGAAFDFAEDQGSGSAYPCTNPSNNLNCATVSQGAAQFQESYMGVVLGMINQLGVTSTQGLLSFLGRRPIHTLIDPALNHYLIGQYAYPMKTNLWPGGSTLGYWVPTWAAWQSGYTALPSSFSSSDPCDCVPSGVDSYAEQLGSATSFLTGITVDGLSGANAYAQYRNVIWTTEPQPRWSIGP